MCIKILNLKLILQTTENNEIKVILTDWLFTTFGNAAKKEWTWLGIFCQKTHLGKQISFYDDSINI